MERLQVISHKGKSILYINFSGLNTGIKKEFQELIDQVNKYNSKQPLNSILALTDFTGVQFDLEIVAMIINYAIHNKPYIKFSAIIGIEGFSDLILNSAKKISRRDNIQNFSNQDAALDWLVQQ